VEIHRNDDVTGVYNEHNTSSTLNCNCNVHKAFKKFKDALSRVVEM